MTNAEKDGHLDSLLFVVFLFFLFVLPRIGGAAEYSLYFRNMIYIIYLNNLIGLR